MKPENMIKPMPYLFENLAKLFRPVLHQLLLILIYLIYQNYIFSDLMKATLKGSN